MKLIDKAKQAAVEGAVTTALGYLEKDPEYKEKIYQTASRLTSENMSEYKVSGVSMTVDPVVVWLDKQKFENFGVELPSSDWTYDDMLALAEKLTGEKIYMDKDERRFSLLFFRNIFSRGEIK